MTKEIFETLIGSDIGRQNKILDKATRLEQKKQEKLDRLNSGEMWENNQLDSMGTGSTTLGGTTYTNHNKIFNEDTAAQRQGRLSDFNNQGYRYDADTKKYYSNVDNSVITGKIGGLYHGSDIAGQGKEKFGYYTLDADSGLSPQEQLETNYDKYRKSFNGEELRSGYEPTRDNTSILLSDTHSAKGMEAYLHGNKDNLAGRTYDLMDTKNLEEGAGRSYTEIVNSGSALGDTSQMQTGDELGAMTLKDMQKIAINKDTWLQRQLTKGAARDRIIAGMRESRSVAEETADELENAAKSFAVSLYDEAISKPAAWLEEITIGRQETEDERQARVDNIFGIGYDREEATVKGLERKELNKVFDDPKATIEDKIEAGIEIVGNAITDGTLIGSSFGTLAAWLFPGKVLTKGTKGVAKLAQIDKLVGAGKLTKAQGVGQKVKYLNTTKEGMKTALKRQSGMINAAIGNLNQQYDEWVENNHGKEYEGGRTQWMIERAPIQLINQNLDKLTDISILKSPQLLRGLKDTIVGATNKQMGTFLGGVAKTLGSTAFIQMPKEATQEYIQSTMEAFNTRYGTAKFDDVNGFIEFVQDPRNYTEARLAGLEGAGGAAQFQVAGTIPKAVQEVPAIMDATKRQIEKATETPEQKMVRESVELNEPLRQQAVDNALKGDAVEVAAGVDVLHGKFIGELDESAPKKYTYKTVMRRALAKAVEENDPAAIEQVYKTMAKLDKSDAKFSMKDLVEDTTYTASQDFLKVINKTNKENVLNEVQSIQKQLNAEKERLKSVMGSGQFSDTAKGLEDLMKVVDDYIAGKGLDTVNEEIAELGFIVAEGDGLKADPNRPGLKVYEKELTEQMLNPKKNKNLLDENVLSTAKVTLTGTAKNPNKGLTNFAESRLRKLYKGKGGGPAYQTAKLIGSLKTENEQMLKTIKNLLITAQGLQGIDQVTKDSYVTELETAANSAIEASAEIDRRKAILDQVKDKGSYAFQIEPDGTESIQKITGKNSKGKFTTVKYADVVNGELVPVKGPVEPAKMGEPYDEGVSSYAEAKETLAGLYTEPAKVGLEAEPKATPDTVLSETRKLIDGIGGTLKEAADQVDDMNLKAAVRNYYKSELGKISEKQSVLKKGMEKLEKAIQTKNKSVGKLINIMRKLALEILANIDKMMVKLEKAKAVNKELKQHQNKLIKEMDKVLKSIDKVETAYKVQYGIPKKTEQVTPLGIAKKYEDSVYGPMVEVGDTRVKAEIIKKKRGEGNILIQTALNNAMNKLGEEKAAELMKDGSLGGKLIADKIVQFGLSSPITRILEKLKDTVFGRMGKTIFNDAEKLIDELPSTFKDIFTSKDETRKMLVDNIAIMAKWVNGIAINDIKLDPASRMREGKNVDNSGLVMQSHEKDGTLYNFPVEILELLGNVGETKVPYTYLNKDGKTVTKSMNKLELDERIETVLKFYSAKMVADTQAMVGKMATYDEADIAKYFGVHSIEEQMELKMAASEGFATAASIRSNIGNDVYNALGIKFTESTPEFTEESFKSSLGALVQSIAVESGALIAESKTYGEKNQRMLKVNVGAVNNILGTEENGTRYLAKAINKLQYMNENISRPLLSKTKPEPVENGKRLVMNTKVPVADSDNQMMNAEEAKAYTVDVDKLEKYINMPDEDFLKSRGYIDPKTLPVGQRLAQQGKNDKLIREWDLLKTVYYAMGKDEFYLNWGQTVSGRFTILNDIQYQESKLHREFVHEVGAEAKVDWKDEKTRVVLEGSVLQGLDMDPDKLSVETAREKFAELVKVTDEGILITPSVDKNGKVNETEQAVKDLYETLRDTGKINVEASAKVFADSEGHHGISSIELLVDWDVAIRADAKEFTTKVQLESDAITSGMILTLLQIGTKKALEFLEKGGVYTKEQLEDRTAYVKYWLGKDVKFNPGALIEAGKAHAAVIEAGNKATAEQKAMLKGQETDITSNVVFKDLYSTIGVAMLEDVKKYKEKLEEIAEPNESEVKQLAIFKQLGELNLKNIRSIAKSPVMVYVYGASMNTIKTKLGFSLGVDVLTDAIKTVSKMWKRLEAEDKLTKDEKVELNKATEFVNLFIPSPKFVDELGKQVDVIDMPWSEKVLHMEINSKLIEEFKGLVDESFGTSIESAFDEEFGFIDENRDAMKTLEVLQFEIYQIKLAEKVRQRLAYKRKTRNKLHEISERDLREINDELVAEGFGHIVVWENGNETKYQTMNKTKKVGSPNSTNVVVGNNKETVQIKEHKPTVNTGAMATIPIHAIDGNLLLETLNSEASTGGKNIYDAIATMLDAELVKTNGQVYNTKVVETGFDRSIIADQLKLVNSMLINSRDPEIVSKVAKKLGLSPEGDSRVDYKQEVNRLGLGIGRMLEVLEIVEQNNKERVENSKLEYGVGHMYIMGQEVTTVGKSIDAKAKELPQFDELKKLLNDVKEADRAQTQKKFGGILHKDTDYVFNLDDITNQATQVESAGNIAQIALKPDGKKLKVDGKQWGMLSANDTVEIIGQYEVPSRQNSQSWYYNNIMKGILNSDANVVTKMDLSESGRELVNGVWVKPKKDEGKDTTKQKEDIMTPSETFRKNVDKPCKD